MWYTFLMWSLASGTVLCHIHDSAGQTYNEESSSKCWMSLRSPDFFRAMDKLDEDYAIVRKKAQEQLDKSNFNRRVLEKMLVDGVVVHKNINKNKPYQATMPGGLNLGGLSMIKLPYSILFFHRLSLRNDTLIRLNVLHNDIENFVLRAQLSMNGLHLKGGYDHCFINRNPSLLTYKDTIEEIQVFVEDIIYIVEGRYRLVKDRIVIEMIVSSLRTRNVMMTFSNASDTDRPVLLKKQNIGDFMGRLKTDLDKWIKDYFNDHLILTDIKDVHNISSLREYNSQKTAKLAGFTDIALAAINERIRSIVGDNISVPPFKIIVAYGLTIEIYDGTLHGLNTMYRKTVATTMSRRQNVRFVNTIIGFKDLKMSYRYEVNFPPSADTPPTLTGIISVSGNELDVQLSIGLLQYPEVVQLDITFLNPIGSESLMIEGAANILRTNFKHILQYEVSTLMSKSLMYGVGLLRTLPTCVPFVPGMQNRTDSRKKMHNLNSLDYSIRVRSADHSVYIKKIT